MTQRFCMSHIPGLYVVRPKWLTSAGVGPRSLLKPNRNLRPYHKRCCYYITAAGAWNKSIGARLVWRASLAPQNSLQTREHCKICKHYFSAFHVLLCIGLQTLLSTKVRDGHSLYFCVQQQFDYKTMQFYQTMQCLLDNVMFTRQCNVYQTM